MKCVAYIRVSTEKQAEEGYGLESQKRDIEEYCKRNHLIITNGTLMPSQEWRCQKELVYKTLFPMQTSMKELSFINLTDWQEIALTLFI